MFLDDGMLCPICEVGYMKEERNYTYVFGDSIVVENCTRYTCNICNESLFGDESDKKIDHQIMMLRQKGNDE